MKTLHLIVKGKVQGVYFRASAKEAADELGIRGWVRNLPDKNVEIKAAGNDEQLEKFIQWCKQGPPQAAVSDVEVADAEPENFSSFEILRSRFNFLF